MRNEEKPAKFGVVSTTGNRRAPFVNTKQIIIDASGMQQVQTWKRKGLNSSGKE